jgi:2,4-dienoyl-CoA reductase-like NADH-dependent reductase (Old Yellow Enzyme family)/thioredoxin reductase
MQMKLLETFRLGHLELKNRIVHPPVMRNMATSDGFVSERCKASYEAVAKGGVGLIITGAVAVDPRGRLAIGQLSIFDDKFIPGLKELAEVIHKHGAKAAIQLHHGGVKVRRDVTGLQAIGASKPANVYVYHDLQEDKEGPREMTLGEIHHMVTLYAEAADRAKKAGFDGIEIQAGGPGFLINQFISSFLNKRRDAYGGEMKNRVRFLQEVLRAVRETVGTSFLIWCRINAEWAMDVNTTSKEAIELAGILRNSGLTALHVSGQPAIRPFYSIPGYFVHCAETIKRVSGLPVIAGGGIDVEIGERILEENRADLVAMARPLIADPELPNKLAMGKVGDIRPCLGCCHCLDCAYYDYKGKGVTCMVNPVFGNESQHTIRSAPKKKEVVVVGGGPAGMEAARVAAERGHRVTLYEKAPTLGGQLLLASLPPNKNRIERLRKYLETQMMKSGVKVEMSKELNASMIRKISPDSVILATGSSPMTPEIPGIDCDHVGRFEDVLTGKTEVGGKVVIIGGGMLGCEMADFLARKGKSVTVVEMLDVMMKEMNPSIVRGALLDILALERVNLMVDSKVVKITKKGLIVRNKMGKREMINADTIVLAVGCHSNNELSQALKGKIPEVYVVGDHVKPRHILEAIGEGFRVALNI